MLFDQRQSPRVSVVFVDEQYTQVVSLHRKDGGLALELSLSGGTEPLARLGDWNDGTVITQAFLKQSSAEGGETVLSVANGRPHVRCVQDDNAAELSVTQVEEVVTPTLMLQGAGGLVLGQVRATDARLDLVDSSGKLKSLGSTSNA